MCAILTIPVYGLLAFAHGVHPLVSTIWLGVTYSIAAVSFHFFNLKLQYDTMAVPGKRGTLRACFKHSKSFNFDLGHR